MSPIINSFGGGIEKIYQCTLCLKQKTTIEEFVGLNFKLMSSLEVDFIRSKFSQQSFTEGLVYKEQPAKKFGFIGKLIGKKKEDIPVLTIRDYLCHLNYTRSANQ